MISTIFEKGINDLDNHLNNHETPVTSEQTPIQHGKIIFFDSYGFLMFL